MNSIKIVMICMCVLLTSHLSAFAQNVDFPDANLAAAIRDALGLTEDADILLTDLESLRYLYAENSEITDLTGLDAAINLIQLSLVGNPISDFTPIRSLTDLTTLNLTDTGFSNSDISVLSPLTALTVLYLEKNKISDLQALVTAIGAPLARLNLSGNQITGFNLLGRFSTLTHLWLERTGISDLTPLSTLTSLGFINLDHNRISNLEPLRVLDEVTHLYLDGNRISDLEPLSGLTNLYHLSVCWNLFPLDSNPFDPLRGLSVRSVAVDTTYETEARDVFGDVYGDLNREVSYDFCTPRPEPTPESDPETEPEPKVKQRKYITRCELGWTPQSQYQRQGGLPKVMIYALEFEWDPEGHGRYSCKAIEIRTGDDAIENLAGWNLYLGTLYNPSIIPITIPEAHSQITGRILRITPEMLGLETFPCNTVGGISHPLPGVHYVLKTDENILVDTAYSCFLWGQKAWTTVNSVNVQSQRRISSAALREMETPRLERYISNNIGVFITYMDIEAFTWDRVVLSDWLLASSEPSAPGAPSMIRRKLVMTWGALKK